MSPTTSTFDTGNTGFMILAASLVMLMTPGLAFFYGGLVGRKNVLAIMIQSFVSMGWTTVLWYLCGYSLCFSGNMDDVTNKDFFGILGNLNMWCLNGVHLDTVCPFSPNDPHRRVHCLSDDVCHYHARLDYGGVYQPGDIQRLHDLPHRLVVAVYFPFVHMVWGGDCWPIMA